MTVGMNRAFVSLSFTGPDGKTRAATCWLDTGGSRLMLRRDFARALGLTETGPAVNENGERLIPVEPPQVVAGDQKVSIPASDAVMLDSDRMVSGVDADVLFPVRLLRDRAVSFDYVGHRFGIGVDAPAGAQLDVEISPHSGFARLPVTISGETTYLLLDSGASCTMLSEALISQLRSQHPDWRTVRGAYDDANMLGGTFEANAQELLLPEIGIAGLNVADVAVVSRPEGTFEHWMSSLMTGPIVGSLGGNVLHRFNVTIDYPNSRLYLDSAGHRASSHPLALVPLTITPNDDGTYDIVQILDDPAYASLRIKLIGSQLVSVDGTPVSDRRIADVHTLLRGIPKTSKRITVMRDGHTQSYDVPVIVLWDIA